MPWSLLGSIIQKREYILRTNQGNALIWLLSLDPDPLWEFASEMLTIILSQEGAELGFHIIGN